MVTVNRDPASPPESPLGNPRAGACVTEALGYDGGRLVTVYVPPDQPEAIVFAGDGQVISRWGGLLEAADVPSTMIVGVHAVLDETLRLQEYSPGFDPGRFAAHARFFVEDVGAWVRSRFGVTMAAERTAVFGVSAGGELALALGLRHPDRYGAIFSGSPGAGFRPPEAMPTPAPRTYLVAGTREPFFLDNAARWAAALRNVDAEVVMSERAAQHDVAMWREEFPLMIAWAFGRRRASCSHSLERGRCRPSVGGRHFLIGRRMTLRRIVWLLLCVSAACSVVVFCATLLVGSFFKSFSTTHDKSMGMTAVFSFGVLMFSFGWIGVMNKAMYSSSVGEVKNAASRYPIRWAVGNLFSIVVGVGFLVWGLRMLMK